MLVRQAIIFRLHLNPWVRRSERNGNKNETAIRKRVLCTARAYLFGDPYGIRTHDTAVKGRCLNRLTKGPLYIIIIVRIFKVVAAVRFEPTTCRV